ncbi:MULTISPECIES: hypothetical protein [Methylomonas]|uniref:Uncharacterized protein n=1 Tax=Methylomonas koyamae TaxID=702114 RepID=A0A177NTX6_9GAMM|nr:hypothetical protein [Methylomonas koyamae]OAI21014.1 hypothetical protein A1355_00075 [Methylomonas koyamae]
MFKIYKRTIHIGTSENPQGRLEYKVEESSGSGLPKMVTVPAMIAGAIVGTLVFSVLFVILLIPLGIVGYKGWRLMKSAQQENFRQGQGDIISTEYSVISDSEPDKK